MPEVRNCKQCKKIFMFVTGPQICDDCKKLDEEDFNKVRKFLRDYPGATMNEVSSATEVPVNKIHRYLKDDRIEVSEDSPIALQCETCGVRIKSGRFCMECSKKVARDMMSAGKNLQDSLQQSANSSSTQANKDFGLRYKHKDEK